MNYDKKLNVLFVQDSSPCIRTNKLATALNSNGMNIHIAHRGRTPDVVYGYGNNSFKSLRMLPRFKFMEIGFIRNIIKQESIDLLHFHNQPDRLGAKMIEANFGIPVVYDQHDFMSFKHKLSATDRKYERICNEKADATVYITESYKNEVGKHYKLIENSICFANYFPSANTLQKADFLPKLSAKDGKTHIAYLGRISEGKDDQKNVIEFLKDLSEKGFHVHVYPSRNKEYRKYKEIPNLEMHKNLPYGQLIIELSQYDYGGMILNDTYEDILPHLQYSLANKIFDYICAGIPVLVQDILTESRDLVINNGFGMLIDDATPENLPKGEDYNNLVAKIIAGRDEFSTEHQVKRVLDFYYRTLELYNAKT